MNQAGIAYTDALILFLLRTLYNAEIASWAKSMGIQLINFTQAAEQMPTILPRKMKNYKPRETIYKQVLSKEKEKGLNGYIILIHLGNR